MPINSDDLARIGTVDRDVYDALHQLRCPAQCRCSRPLLSVKELAVIVTTVQDRILATPAPLSHLNETLEEPHQIEGLALQVPAENADKQVANNRPRHDGSTS